MIGISIHLHEPKTLAILEGARAYEREDGSILVLAQVRNLSGRVADEVRLHACLLDELCNVLAVEELAIGRLHAGEQRPVSMCLVSLEGEVTLVSLTLSYDIERSNEK